MKDGENGDNFVQDTSITRYSRYLISKISENSTWNHIFKDIFGSEEKYFSKLKSDKLDSTVLGLLQFNLEILGKSTQVSSCSTTISQNSGHTSPTNSGKPPAGFYNSAANDEFSKIYNEAQALKERLSQQKLKIEKTYENVIDTVGISKKISSTPSLSRPVSAFSNRVLSPDEGKLTPSITFNSKDKNRLSPSG